jgi:hypothetical protein
VENTGVFVALTAVAGADVMLDSLGHLGPVVMVAQKFVGTQGALMSARTRVVDGLKEAAVVIGPGHTATEQSVAVGVDIG